MSKIIKITEDQLQDVIKSNMEIPLNAPKEEIEDMKEIVSDIEKGNFRKSPMNYTGGKHKLLPQLVPLFPKNIRTFVDLFCGGCDITINVAAKKIIANDLNNNVVDFYNEIKDMSIEQILAHIDEAVNKYNLTIDNAEGYNAFRDYYNHSGKDPLDLFILICYSFNHQIRFNKSGDYNMPFGKNRSYFNDNIKKNLIEFHKAITTNNVVFTNYSFRDIKVDKLGPEDFVYCDPPYLITCATYNEQGGWGESEERDLYALLDRLNQSGVKFGLSNVMMNKGKTNDILIQWAEKYNVHHLNMTYSNCNYHALDKNVKGTDEVFVTNY